MNERFRELAQQAGYAPLEPRAFADDLQEVFLQKFAELIVRECLSHTKDGDIDFMKFMIRKHFGVEE